MTFFAMKRLAFFDTKPYDRESFDRLNAGRYEIRYFETRLTAAALPLADGCDAACAFVNAEIDRAVVEGLVARGIKVLAMRCAGYNNVDFKAAYESGLTVVRVPAYSPYAAAGPLPPEPRRKPPLPDGALDVPPALVLGADGSCFACRKPDVAGRRGRNGGEAKGRNANVMAACRYAHVGKNGKPVPEGGIRYGATGSGGERLGDELWRMAVREGVLDKSLRVVFVSDGERELEEVFQTHFAAIPGVVRVLDAMHACQYVDTVAKTLEPDPGKAAKSSRRLRRRLSKSGWNAFLASFHAIFGNNAESRLHGDSPKAWKYLESRKAMMDYGNLRRRHIPIGSGMLECGCKLVIGSRLKGPGMHWRFNNGILIAALRAALRSHLLICA